MTVFGYWRCSTTHQDGERQVLALKAAGAEGNVGPNLDTVDLTIESVVEMVTYGLGVMPAYGEEEILTKEEIEIVSYFVANSAGK